MRFGKLRRAYTPFTSMKCCSCCATKRSVIFATSFERDVRDWVVVSEYFDVRASLLSTGVTTAGFIGGGTTADDSDVLMIRVRASTGHRKSI